MVEMPGGGYVEIFVWDQAEKYFRPDLIGAPPSMVLFYGDINTQDWPLRRERKKKKYSA